MNESIQSILQERLPFWKDLTETQRGTLVRGTKSARYEKGSMIHGGNGRCTGGILVLSGCARVYAQTDGKREVTLYRLEEGDLCMLSASCVLEEITFDVFVVAEEAVDCLVINPDAFSKVVKENVLAENFALRLTVERFSDVMWALQRVVFQRFDKRLAGFLYDEMVSSKSDMVMKTQEEIASMLASAREVVSRMLKDFAKDGIIQTGRGYVRILDKEKLKKLALE
jgi:CRP/FNR family transcriptional regulator